MVASNKREFVKAKANELVITKSPINIPYVQVITQGTDKHI